MNAAVEQPVQWLSKATLDVPFLLQGKTLCKQQLHVTHLIYDPPLKPIQTECVNEHV